MQSDDLHESVKKVKTTLNRGERTTGQKEADWVGNGIQVEEAYVWKTRKEPVSCVTPKTLFGINGNISFKGTKCHPCWASFMDHQAKSCLISPHISQAQFHLANGKKFCLGNRIRSPPLWGPAGGRGSGHALRIILNQNPLAVCKITTTTEMEPAEF